MEGWQCRKVVIKPMDNGTFCSGHIGFTVRNVQVGSRLKCLQAVSKILEIKHHLLKIIS